MPPHETTAHLNGHSVPHTVPSFLADLNHHTAYGTPIRYRINFSYEGIWLWLELQGSTEIQLLVVTGHRMDT